MRAIQPRLAAAAASARTSAVRGILAAGQQLGHLRRDRQLDAVARRRAPSAASVVRTPSATIFMPARTSCSERPRASSMPTWRLRLSAAGARQHQIAKTGQPGQRFALRARGAGQPRQSRPARA